MGQGHSTENEKKDTQNIDKVIEKPEKPKSSIKKPKQNRVNPISLVSNGYNEKEDRGNINIGLNNHQYFRVIPEIMPSSENTVCVNSRDDSRFREDVNNLYQNELNNRDMDYGNAQKIAYRNKPIPVNTIPVAKEENVDVHSAYSQNNHFNQNNQQNNFREGVNTNEVTITREEALKIKDIKKFKNVDKRLMIMNNITINELDPMNMLKNKPNLTLDDLNSQYLSLRNIYHPDKGGSTEMFILVNRAVKHQLFLKKSRVIDKDFIQLKNGWADYSIKKKKPVSFSCEEVLNPESFCGEKFNKFFNENKFGDDTNDIGYGDIMDNTGEREDISVEKTIDKYNKTDFNEKFSNIKQNSKNIVLYKIPDAVNNTHSYKQLGKDENNFTVTGGNTINYCDYYDAFNRENVINTGDVSIPENIDLEQYKKNRANDKLEISDEIYREIEKKEELEKEYEHQRMENIKDFDYNLDIHYNKINKLMLK